MNAAFFDLCKALPKFLQENILVKKIVSIAYSYLPGFSWVLSALYGFTIGLIIWEISRKGRFVNNEIK